MLFEAAWNLKWKELKLNFLPICLYAVLGVVISIAGIAFGLNQLAGISLTTALLIGASLSATDPVSVTALFRELGVSEISPHTIHPAMRYPSITPSEKSLQSTQGKKGYH